MIVGQLFAIVLLILLNYTVWQIGNNKPKGKQQRKQKLDAHTKRIKELLNA